MLKRRHSSSDIMLPRKRKRSIYHLPNEILCEVFSYLHGRDLRSASMVSRLWNGLASSFMNHDILFICDITSSVNYWDDLQRHYITIRQTYQNYRVGFVGYRDHGDRDLLITSLELNYNCRKFQYFIEKLRPTGGGDINEALLDGLYFGLNLNWRSGVKKTIILMADALPHGFGSDPLNDDFPEGCPCGLNKNFLISQIKKEKINLHLFYSPECPEIKNLFLDEQISSIPYNSDTFPSQVMEIIDKY